MNSWPRALCILLFPCATFSQETERECSLNSTEFSRNRLFTVSTGRTMPTEFGFGESGSFTPSQVPFFGFNFFL